MTRKEAIEVFNYPTNHIKLIKGQIAYSQFFVEAMEMAIEALEREQNKEESPISIRIENMRGAECQK